MQGATYDCHSETYLHSIIYVDDAVGHPCNIAGDQCSILKLLDTVIVSDSVKVS